MGEAKYPLGRVVSLAAEAVGAPGQRRFYLVVQAQGGTATLWMEKQELFQLAIAIQQLLTRVPEASEERPTPGQQTGLLNLDFNVVQLTVGLDSARTSFHLEAWGVTQPVDGAATISAAGTPGQFKALAARALEVCAAGRPACPLCGAPMGQEPHVCPRANGHTSP
ncbi:MAG: DUF3090 family protein [Chloroflexi bacterium]|nr:DUF3090 family protein [Chloroflexota bacterium]